MTRRKMTGEIVSTSHSASKISDEMSEENLVGGTGRTQVAG